MLRSNVRTLTATLLASIVAAATPLAAQAPAQLADASSFATGAPVETVARALRTALGPVEVVVKLSDPPLAVANGRNSRRVGGLLSPGQQRSHSQGLSAKQSALMAQMSSLPAST